MRRFFLLILVWLLAAPMAHGTDRGALFRLTLDGHVMHLFGTLHVGLPDFYPLEDRLTGALAEASTLALEIDPDQPRADLQEALRAYGMLAPGNPAYDSLPPLQKRRLDRLLQQGGLDASFMLGFKPVLLATMLTLAEYTRQGYRADLSSDAWLARQARRRHVRVLALESLGGQLALLDRLPMPDRWRFLEEMMDTIESGAQRTEAREVVRAWSIADRQALDRMAERCETDRSVSGRFVTQVLLKERNVGLADRLLQLLRAEDRTVAAIGVLHLLGTGSVPALLEQSGVTIERIY
ncbi:TraB/GumN family protein [Massilia kyonggiensis]|nr:TraB/GumN family protein [Massilia kyonggiensis]